MAGIGNERWGPPFTFARPSVASLYLELKFGSQLLAKATGFLVERAGAFFLITNRHNLTGRRTDTGVPLSPTAAVPDRVAIMHNREGRVGMWLRTEEPLYDDETPRWLEHPIYGPRIDVVALRLTALNEIAAVTYDPWVAGPPIAYGPSRPVSVIGFPFGLTGGGALGIWVNGTVATEPSIDFGGLPQFLVDSRTRAGQSGSPVIAYSAGGTALLDDGKVIAHTGALERLVGVYAGRINDQSDLGVVWKTSVIPEIVDGRASEA
jgi:hypothetical protein